MTRKVTLPMLDPEIARWSAVQTALGAGANIDDPIEDLLPEDEAVFEAAWPLLGQVYRV